MDPSKLLGPGMLARFRERALDPATQFPADKEVLAVMRVAHSALPSGDVHHGELQAALHALRQKLFPEPSWRPPPQFYRDHAPLVSHSGEKEHPSQLVHDAASWRQHWWSLSDEVDHAFHFWRSAPQDVLLVVGGFQAYNLLNPRTELLVRVDYDARQIITDAVMGALFLVADEPEDYIRSFLGLGDGTETWRRAVASVSQLEADGHVPSGRTRLLKEAAFDQGVFREIRSSFSGLLRRVQDNGPIHRRERASLNWLIDSRQFRVVRDMYREGRVWGFQANVFDPEEMRPVRDFLRDIGHRVSTFYLSDPQDLVHTSHETSINFEGLGMSLKNLPRHEDAILQWTFLGGVPDVSPSYSNELLPVVSLRYCDNDDRNAYVYLEIPIRRMLEWIPSVGIDLPEEFFFVKDRRHYRPVQYYFKALHEMLRDQGTLADGKLTVRAETNTHERTHRILSAPSRLAWHLKSGRIRWAQSLLEKEMLRVSAMGGLDAVRNYYQRLDGLLTPEGRGRLQKMRDTIEGRIVRSLNTPEERLADLQRRKREAGYA